MTTPKTHAFHRFRKAQLKRPECAAIDPELREEWIEGLWLMSRNYVPVYEERGPRLGKPSAEWTMPDGRRYVFVPGEAP